MSTVATAAKAKSAQIQAQAPAKPQPLRQAQIKKFLSGTLKAIGFGYTDIMTLDVPKGMSFEQAMNPAAWSNIAHVVAKDALNTRNLKDGVGVIVYLDSEDGNWFAIVRIMRILRDAMNNPCGVEAVCIGPSMDLKTGEARPIDLRTRKALVEDPAAE